MKNPDVRTQASDPHAKRFSDAIIWLPGLMGAAMANGQAVIQGRTFTNCLLHGPAVFLPLRGTVLRRCNLGQTFGDIRNLVLRPASPTNVTGAIPFEDCTFEDCDFDKIGFTGDEEFVASMLAVQVQDAS